MTEYVSFKELYDVYLKATYPMEIGNRVFEVGEPIAHFDKIQISGLQEQKEMVSAHGGFGDAPRVYWDTTKQIQLNFSQGVFSKLDFAIATNSGVIETSNSTSIWITRTEKHESNEEGKFELDKMPCGQIFVYKTETGEKVGYELSGKQLEVNERFTDYTVVYQWDENGGAKILTFGRRLTEGFLRFEGKTRVKDDNNGLVTTGLFVIPKLKLVSGLSIALGAQANPTVAKFSGFGVPMGSKGDSRVCELYFLNSDIDSDM